jgi:outer membrane receptor for ferrienterochelin and colicin
MKLAVTFILCVFPLLVASQTSTENITLNSNYDSMTFVDFVNRVEQDHNVKFYFNKSWVDSIVVKQSLVPVSLRQLLNDSFKELPLKYLIDGTNIIITKNYQIVRSLPDDYFIVKSENVDISTKTDDGDYAFLKKPDIQIVDSKNKIINIGKSGLTGKDQNCVISGIVKSIEDGSPITGATVYSRKMGVGTVTDRYGYYVLSLPCGNHEIEFKFMGREDMPLQINANGSGTLNVNMKQSAVLINEVVITSEKENNLKNLNIGVQQLNMEEVKQLPAILGESDIIKTTLLLPGVQTVGEGASGFNVRGGSTDQNLVLYDDAPIFNTSHLFGFFSVFNPETIKDFKLYKSGIPANFGGRVSSVFDVSAEQGNLKKPVISGGISPVTGKLTAEGPIIKDKLSIIVGGRSTYSDWILKKINTTQFKKSTANFYDLSGKLHYEINQNNSLSLTAYQSKDYFKLNSDTAYHYENQLVRLFFKHHFNPQTYGQVSAIYSNYQYQITSDQDPATSYKLKYGIDYKAIKTSLFYFPNTTHSFSIGTEIARYDMTPGDYLPFNAESDIKSMKIPKEAGLEGGLFITDEYKVNPRLTISAGIRYALFLALGPYKKYEYNPNVPRSIDSRMDSIDYSANEVVQTYGGPEFRLSARYLLGYNNSVKLSYNRLHQFLHMLSNSTAISPTDVWKICDGNIKPLIGDQFAIGYYHNLLGDAVEASVEAYYKKIRNSLDYKNGTELLLNPNLDVDLLTGVGRAYGIELFVQKKRGMFNGWISYTYSKTELKVDGPFSEEKINNGNYYPANYDKPHNLNLVTNYKFSRRVNLSSTFNFSTGRPITYPVAKYMFRDRQLIHYTDRNEYRIPNYMRWDVSATIYENLKSKKIIHNSLSIGVYNLIGVDNVYSIYFKSSSRGIHGYKLSIFSRAIPNITYNFRF